MNMTIKVGHRGYVPENWWTANVVSKVLIRQVFWNAQIDMDDILLFQMEHNKLTERQELDAKQ